jgi:hypothetical protein
MSWFETSVTTAVTSYEMGLAMGIQDGEGKGEYLKSVSHLE